MATPLIDGKRCRQPPFQWRAKANASCPTANSSTGGTKALNFSNLSPPVAVKSSEHFLSRSPVSPARHLLTGALPLCTNQQVRTLPLFETLRYAHTTGLRPAP
jgi:hypothetical protein